MVQPGFMGGISKKSLGFVNMEYVGDPEEKLEFYPAPSGRRYKFNGEDCRELVHPMDMNYLRAIYPIERVPWRGVE